MRSSPHCAARYRRLLPDVIPKASQATLPRGGSCNDLDGNFQPKDEVPIPGSTSHSVIHHFWEGKIPQKSELSDPPDLIKPSVCCNNNLMISSLSLDTAMAKGVKPWVFNRQVTSGIVTSTHQFPPPPKVTNQAAIDTNPQVCLGVDQNSQGTHLRCGSGKM